MPSQFSFDGLTCFDAWVECYLAVSWRSCHAIGVLLSGHVQDVVRKRHKTRLAKVLVDLQQRQGAAHGLVEPRRGYGVPPGLGRLRI